MKVAESLVEKLGVRLDRVRALGTQTAAACMVAACREAEEKVIDSDSPAKCRCGCEY